MSQEARGQAVVGAVAVDLLAAFRDRAAAP